MNKIKITNSNMKELTADHIQRLSDARHELAFLKNTTDAEILELASSVPGFDELRQLYNFRIDRSVRSTLQLSFGNRPIGMMTIDQKRFACEHGPTLVYSLGPTGDFAVLLYPAKSDLGGVYEDHLFLHIGRVGGIVLLDRMADHIRDLVAYAHVSSITMKPTLRERARIELLRLLCHRQQDGKFKRARIRGGLLGIANFSARAFATATMKPLALGILILLGAYLGWHHLVAVLASFGGAK